MENNSKIRISCNESVNKEFFLRGTTEVARGLLGCILVRKSGKEILAARIVETEAYLAENDLASHSAPGLTARNAPMFEEGGVLYVYKIYGVHHCINFVTEKKGSGCAVLIRAAEPIAGIGRMMKNRSNNNIEALCKGPGNLARAFGFTVSDNFASLTGEDLFIRKKMINEELIVSTERIGITKSKELKLRFILKKNKFVSGRKK